VKLNLYIPSEQERKTWEDYAAREQRSLSNFIRTAVHEKIQRMDAHSEDDEELEL
jgi:hypothetical protein